MNYLDGYDIVILYSDEGAPLGAVDTDAPPLLDAMRAWVLRWN